MKEVDQDDHEGGEDTVGIHGGGSGEDVETEENRFIYPQNTGVRSRPHSEKL
jgi:hypothetical protein